MVDTELSKTAVLETRTTRDARVPLYADDPEMLCGWRGIPLPPQPDEHGEWQRDYTYDGGHKARWFRFRIDK